MAKAIGEFMATIDGCAKNTDKEIWREIIDDWYSPSIHVTERGEIGINVGGRVFVKTVEEWHKLAREKDNKPCLK